MFVLGDANGHLSIYGPCINNDGHNVQSRGRKVPREQFFNTDYHAVIRDRLILFRLFMFFPCFSPIYDQLNINIRTSELPDHY